ncbi:DUF6701 domain-containing protein [Vibrio cyclitrophicus]|uniref:DUF6701 domain-containing protein n=2 Tax=Vibrio TaxID=662 RepID=UPI000C84462C|nr:DUF6701 domain-containing protein [Vibrio cyclitrophicus]MCC4775591.1 hypothetical protein [Vibrio cyclitrophicus]MCC4842614.1 hypothetical protein [Vibrio cyclitrophicus]PME15573.1 hypothetical protein BCV42_14480 [Vibrio cyclitrophicus]PME45034.1 hypothetical protein BCV37_15035 [Vibrio cyclitrophicus]PME83375.1 hypothetical protein BCV28_12555 [Vibrio cyclitrophicus]
MVVGESKNLGLKLRIGLLVILFFMTSSAYSIPYDLNNSDDFGQLCTGNHSTSNNPRVYLCEGQFKADNAVVSLDGGSVINAYSGYDIKSTTIEPTSGYVELQSNNWGGDTNLDSVVLKGSIYVPYAISIKNSNIEKYVKNTTYHNISIYSSVIGEYVDAGTTITIDGSDVIGYVSNRNNNDISVLNDSEIGGYIDGGTTITIDDSEVSGNVVNRSDNNIYVLNDSEIGGYIDGGTTITIDDSEVTGNVINRSNNEIFVLNDSEIGGDVAAQGKLNIFDSEIDGNISSANHNIELDNGAEVHGNATAANNNWATIHFNDYDDSDRSVVHGTCLYRTEPEDACGAIEPPINQNPQFEFGTLTKDSCRIIESGTNDDADRQRVSCTLEFDKTYTTVPLVFVMPTIDASLSVLSARTTELPSTASVIGTSLTSATVVQEIAPSAKRNTSNTTYLDAPMLSDEDLNSLNIDYFVIQEGVISLGNGKGRIVAGLVETNTAASQISSERNNADLIKFEDFGLSTFSNIPGVLVQPQTKNNSSAWFTGMARGVNTERFYLALEKSEVINNNDISEPEKVAFVAGEGSGITQGARFFLGNGETRVTTTLNEKVISPIEIGCEESTSISEANFDAPPILIANKNSRSGNNGGWVRRCHVTEDEVYFIVEEDMDKDSERSHIAEDVGFFMFDRPNELGICDGFNNKSPVQTWIRTDGTIGAFEAYNSSRVIGSFKDGNRRYLGFDDDWVTDGTNWSTGGACDGLECGGLEDLMVPKELLEDMPDNLTVSVNVNAGDTLTLPLTDSDGQPIYEYQTLNVGGIVTIEAGKYKIGSINVWEDGEVQVKSGDSVTIFTNKLQLNNRAFFGVPIDSRVVDKPTLEADTYLRVNVLESNSNSVNINSNSSTKPSTFVGLLYSEQPVRISNDARIYGGVAAESVHMSGQSLISAATSCMLPSDDYEIEISPATDLALMCGDDSPQFTINTSNNGVAESLGVTVAITPDADEFDISVQQGSGTGVYPNYVSNDDGELTLKVVAKETANIDFDSDYTLTATLMDDSGKEVASQFKFVPFKFSLVDGNSPTNRLDVIAGQATPTVTKVLACDLGDSIVVAENYVGEAEKQVTITHELDNSWNGSDGTLTYLPEFKKGSASTDLTISESGLFNVTLKDSSFDCTGFAGCPDDGSYDLEGSFSIYSRPWQFAICTDNNSDGNSSSGAAFVAAGEAFDVYARPIKYTNSSSVCGDDNLLTYNYFKSTASVEVTTTLDTPLITVYPDAKLGDLTPETQLAKQISSNDQSNKGYKFESLKYSEVGSFNFVATETGSFYGSILGGFSGSKSIGRFYPKYFIQGSPEWNVANQNDIAYLSQPYDSTVHQVYPMASGENDTDNALNNYRFFSSDLQASFGILDDASVDNGFLLDTGAGTWSADRKHWLLNDSAAVLQRVTDSDDVSRRDTPFNTSDANSTATNFGLTIEGTDPVSFTDSDTLTNSAAFPVQPPARYGRMALDDIGGNSDTTLTIPLRAEFWDGSEFVVNDDDNRSTFNGSNTCKQVIWHSEGVTTTLASLSGSRSVDDGEEEVTANQNTPSGTDAPREQVRLWLRMDDLAPTAKTGENPITCSGSDQEQPWLRYNWRQLGDEDPSTVVTFGIYRGNDRVIYRGESGLTGQ